MDNRGTSIASNKNVSYAARYAIHKRVDDYILQAHRQREMAW